MDNENVMDKALDEVEELYHYGVPGMKWGVRRTPAQLGHKTGSKKRRTKAKKYVESLMKKHKANKEKKAAEKAAKKAEDEQRKRDLANRNKSVKDMSDDELREHLNRVRMEREAYMIDRDIEALNPKKISAGKKFANEFKERALGPAAMEAGRKLMSNLMNKAVDKALGNGGTDAMASLKKEAEKAGYSKIKSEAKKAAIEALEKEYNLKQRMDRDRAKADEDGASKKTAADEAARRANEQRSQQEYEKTYSTYSRTYTKDSPATSASSETRQLGKSYIAGYLPAPVSSISNETRQLGQSYIAGYLPAPKDDD